MTRRKKDDYEAGQQDERARVLAILHVFSGALGEELYVPLKNRIEAGEDYDPREPGFMEGRLMP